MYPVQRSESDQTGGAAVLENEGSRWLQVDARTPRRPGRARISLHELCGDVCEHGGAPRAVRLLFEQYLTISYHILVQLAGTVRRSVGPTPNFLQIARIRPPRMTSVRDVSG